MTLRLVDTFPFAGSPTELLLLEARLTDLYDSVDAFIVVEARVDHQDHPKPLNYLEESDRFSPWKDKITYVVAGPMPSIEDDSWSWAREHAQREFVADGLRELDVSDETIVMHGDADEWVRPLIAKNLRLKRNELVACRQRGHFWAIDWAYPPGWNGTVACRLGALDALKHGRGCGPFTAMRDMRNSAPSIPNAGWHFSWLGGREAWDRKVGSFCHPEVEQRITTNADQYWAEGKHVDGVRMKPVEVDRTWPTWMQNPANVPASWLRPRLATT